MEEQETGLSGLGRATGECWGPVGQKLWKQFCSFDTVLGKILSIGKVHGRRRKYREHAQLRHIQEDKCTEGGKCAEGRQHTDRKNKAQTEE
jgi:hypothetical protein